MNAVFLENTNSNPVQWLSESPEWMGLVFIGLFALLLLLLIVLLAVKIFSGIHKGHRTADAKQQTNVEETTLAVMAEPSEDKTSGKGKKAKKRKRQTMADDISDEQLLGISDAMSRDRKAPAAPPPEKKVKHKKPSKRSMRKALKTKTKKLLVPKTVQESIPYYAVYPNKGIIEISPGVFTKSYLLQDINYQLAQADDKAQIFEGYCDFLNYFDSTISVQLTFINQRANLRDFVQSIDIPQKGDEYDDIRREYADMLKSQMQKGNNGLTKRKYVTFGIEADDLRTAKMRLERIEADVLNNFKALGAQARSLNGLERLEVLHGQLHPDGQEKLRFQWGDLAKTGHSTKDYISPSGLSFSRDGKTFRVGDHSGAVSFLQILAPELTDKMLAEFLDMDKNLVVQSRQ